MFRSLQISHHFRVLSLEKNDAATEMFVPVVGRDAGDNDRVSWLYAEPESFLLAVSAGTLGLSSHISIDSTSK